MFKPGYETAAAAAAAAAKEEEEKEETETEKEAADTQPTPPKTAENAEAGNNDNFRSSADEADAQISMKVVHAMHTALERAGVNRFTEVAKVAVACMALNYGTPGISVDEAKELCTVIYCHWLVLTGMKRSIVRQRNTETKEKRSKSREPRVAMDEKEFALTNKEVEDIVNPFIQNHLEAFAKALPRSYIGYAKINRAWCLMLCDASDLGIRMVNLTRLYAFVLSFFIKGGGNTTVKDKPDFVPEEIECAEERFRMAAEEIRGDYVEEQELFVKRFPQIAAYTTSVCLQVHTPTAASLFSTGNEEGRGGAAGLSGFARGWSMDEVMKEIEEKINKEEGGGELQSQVAKHGLGFPESE